MNKLLNYFSQMGIEHNLNFSCQDFLFDCIIGLDGIHRKILIVTNDDGYYSSSIIDLDQVKNCTVNKVYGSIKVGELKKHKLEQHLQKIVLHLEVKERQPLEIIFYHHFHNHIYEVLELEQKAKHWETILSKMLRPAKAIA